MTVDFSRMTLVCGVGWSVGQFMDCALY